METQPLLDEIDAILRTSTAAIVEHAKAVTKDAVDLLFEDPELTSEQVQEWCSSGSMFDLHPWWRSDVACHPNCECHELTPGWLAKIDLFRSPSHGPDFGSWADRDAMAYMINFSLTHD